MALKQHVSTPTHVHGDTLDLIIARSFSKIITCQPVSDRFMSDHCAVLCNLDAPKPLTSKKSISYRKLKSIDIGSFREDLMAFDLLSDTPEQLEDILPAMMQHCRPYWISMHLL